MQTGRSVATHGPCRVVFQPSPHAQSRLQIAPQLARQGLHHVQHRDGHVHGAAMHTVEHPARLHIHDAADAPGDAHHHPSPLVGRRHRVWCGPLPPLPHGISRARFLAPLNRRSWPSVSAERKVPQERLDRVLARCRDLNESAMHTQEVCLLLLNEIREMAANQTVPQGALRSTCALQTSES